MEASSSIGGVGESARASQESGGMPFTSLRGLRVAFTGAMVPLPSQKPVARQSREERAATRAAVQAAEAEHRRLRELAKQAGAVVQRAVDGSTDLLVAGEQPGSRLAVAQRRGSLTAIVTPARFRAMLEVAS